MKTIYGKKATDLENCYGLRFKNVKSFEKYYKQIIEKAEKTNFGGCRYWASYVETKQYRFNFDFEKLTIYAFNK